MKNIKRYKRKHENIIVTHIQNNLKEYIIASIIFVIGIMLGIFFINNLNEAQSNEISTYISNTVKSLKEKNINEIFVLKGAIKNNIYLVILLWIMGSTVIGLLLVYAIICFKGFCLGYTLSAIIYTLGCGKGILLFITTLFFKNIIAIPCTISLAVSGMKLYKSIMQDRRKENIKMEVIRHTLFSIFILIILLISSIVEINLSKGLFKYCIKWF